MLIHWRVEVPALRDGALRVVDTGTPALVAYERATADSRVLVVHNLAGKPGRFKLATAADTFSAIRLYSLPGAVLDHGELTLPAYATVVLQ